MKLLIRRPYNLKCIPIATLVFGSLSGCRIAKPAKKKISSRLRLVVAFSVVALKVLNISVVTTGQCQFKVAYLNDPNYTFFRSFFIHKDLVEFFLESLLDKLRMTVGTWTFPKHPEGSRIEFWVLESRRTDPTYTFFSYMSVWRSVKEDIIMVFEFLKLYFGGNYISRAFIVF